MPLQVHSLAVFVPASILMIMLGLETPVVAYHQRAKIIPRLPKRVHEMFPRLGNYSRLSTFAEQAEAGMSSAAFDINANITEGDSRMGLDERGTQEVRDIMRRERVKYVVSFDIYVLLAIPVYIIIWTASQLRPGAPHSAEPHPRSERHRSFG